MNARQAMDAPRFHHQWLPDEIKLEPKLAENRKLIEKLKKKGQNPRKVKGLGNAVIISRTISGRIAAVADPRGSGTALVR